MLVRVRVTPEARAESISAPLPGRFEVRVRAKAEGNAANMRVRTLIARHFRVPEKQVRIVSGHHSPNKVLEVLE